MPASLSQGHFWGPDGMYAADDFEAYAVAPVVLLDQPSQRGGPHLNNGHASPQTANYGWDDFELETTGSIHSLHNGGRSGDCLLKNGGFH
jgi:hypothetical protein